MKKRTQNTSILVLLVIAVILIGNLRAQDVAPTDTTNQDIFSMTKIQLQEEYKALTKQRDEINVRLVQIEYGFNLVNWMKTQQDSTEIEK